MSASNQTTIKPKQTETYVEWFDGRQHANIINIHQESQSMDFIFQLKVTLFFCTEPPHTQQRSEERIKKKMKHHVSNNKTNCIIHYLNFKWYERFSQLVQHSTLTHTPNL